MEFIDDQGRGGRFPSAAFRRLFSEGRQDRKSKAAFRSPVHAGNRAARRTFESLARAEKANAAIKRRINRELGLDREVDIWGRSFRIRVKAAAGRAAKRLAASLKGRASARAIMTYSKPIRDQRGRVAVFMRVRYKGFRSSGWRDGMTSEHVHYMYRPEAIEPQSRDAPPVSNMGTSVSEIAAGWEVLEEVEKAYRANAIVQHRVVLGMPYQLSPSGRRRVLERFCERAFERHGLPYAAANHRPDENGDQRNFHAHVAFSTRPMSHVGEHQWEVVQEKVNGITDANGLARMRALFAAIVNQECRREGLDFRFTHQRYDKRGIDARRQEHLGPQLTALHRQGETVDMVARNERTIAANEARQEHREADSEIKATSLQIAQLEHDIQALATLETNEKKREETRSRQFEEYPKVRSDAPPEGGQKPPAMPVDSVAGEERLDENHPVAPARSTGASAEQPRMDEPKEKLVRELSWDEGASLIERLERDRPTLEAKSGIIQPVDTRPFSEAELAWMRRDLAMHRLLFEQQQEEEAAEERKEQVRLAMEVRRMAALERDANRPVPPEETQRSSPAAITGRVPDPSSVPPIQRGGPAEDAATPSAAEPDLPANPEPTPDDVARKAAAAAWAAAQAARGR